MGDAVGDAQKAPDKEIASQEGQNGLAGQQAPATGIVAERQAVDPWLDSALMEKGSGWARCDTCNGEAELLLLLPGHPRRCFNCVLIAAIKRACAICGKHVTEVITRALDQQGHPNTIGTCAQCFQKAAAAQRN